MKENIIEIRRTLWGELICYDVINVNQKNKWYAWLFDKIGLLIIYAIYFIPVTMRNKDIALKFFIRLFAVINSIYLIFFFWKISITLSIVHIICILAYYVEGNASTIFEEEEADNYIDLFEELTGIKNNWDRIFYLSIPIAGLFSIREFMFKKEKNNDFIKDLTIFGWLINFLICCYFSYLAIKVGAWLLTYF